MMAAGGGGGGGGGGCSPRFSVDVAARRVRRDPSRDGRIATLEAELRRSGVEELEGVVGRVREAARAAEVRARSRLDGVREAVRAEGYPEGDDDVEYLLEDASGLGRGVYTGLKGALLERLRVVREVAGVCWQEMDAMVARQAVMRPMAISDVEAQRRYVIGRFLKARQDIINKYQSYLRNLKWLQLASSRQRRGCLTARQNNILRVWLFSNFQNPYPEPAEKTNLASSTGLSATQINNWFINARVRVWKPTVELMTGERMRRETPNPPSPPQRSERPARLSLPALPTFPPLRVGPGGGGGHSGIGGLHQMDDSAGLLMAPPTQPNHHHLGGMYGGGGGPAGLHGTSALVAAAGEAALPRLPSTALNSGRTGDGGGGGGKEGGGGGRIVKPGSGKGRGAFARGPGFGKDRAGFESSPGGRRGPASESGGGGGGGHGGDGALLDNAPWRPAGNSMMKSLPGMSREQFEMPPMGDGRMMPHASPQQHPQHPQHPQQQPHAFDYSYQPPSAGHTQQQGVYQHQHPDYTQQQRYRGSMQQQQYQPLPPPHQHPHQFSQYNEYAPAAGGSAAGRGQMQGNEHAFLSFGDAQQQQRGGILPPPVQQQQMHQLPHQRYQPPPMQQQQQNPPQPHLPRDYYSAPPIVGGAVMDRSYRLAPPLPQHPQNVHPPRFQSHFSSGGQLPQQTSIAPDDAAPAWSNTPIPSSTWPNALDPFQQGPDAGT
jgi:Homeobox KN domain